MADLVVRAFDLEALVGFAGVSRTLTEPPAAMTLGKAEGLDAHARSVGLRLNLS